MFNAAGCSACHTLADARATGTVGPDLDKSLKGKDEAFIRTSIVDPNAEIAKGYSAERDAAELQADPQAGGARRPRQVPCECDQGMRKAD